MAAAKQANLRVVTGNAPVSPTFKRFAPRRQVVSHPFVDDVDEQESTSVMLLTSLCAAWHDIGERAQHVLDELKLKTT